MAEFVRDHALQFVARQIFDRAPVDADHGVARRKAGGKGVNAGLVVEQKHGRNRRAGGQRHLFNHIQQAPLERVV